MVRIKNTKRYVACLIIIAVILLGITYAQDVPIRGDRGERNARLDRLHADDISRSTQYFATVNIEGGAAKAPKSKTITIGPNKAIQWAIDKANDGDTIILKSGTWTENVVIDKPITITGSGAGTTIVNGGGVGSVFTIGKNNPDVDVTISGLTITNGNAVYGGGGIYNNGATLTLDGVSITGNTAFNGGIYTIYGTLNMYAGCSIAGNTPRYGGGIFNRDDTVIMKEVA